MIPQFIKRTLTASLLGSITCISMPANAAHELIYAVDQNNNLFNFYSDAPGTIFNQHAIGGLQSNEEIRGIDAWNGTIYGLGSLSSLYTINPATGQATQIGTTFGTVLNGASFGIDNHPGGVQVVSGLGQNLSIDRVTGVATAGQDLAYGVGDPSFGDPARVDALAYDVATGNWYAADTLQNVLASFNPTTGLLSTIGGIGTDIARFNGMDISPFSGIMYADTPATSSDPQANLYTVDKITGLVTLVGQIGNPGDDILVLGLAVIPEPSSIALFSLGALGFFFARRSRQ